MHRTRRTAAHPVISHVRSPHTRKGTPATARTCPAQSNRPPHLPGDGHRAEHAPAARAKSTLRRVHGTVTAVIYAVRAAEVTARREPTGRRGQRPVFLRGTTATPLGRSPGRGAAPSRHAAALHRGGARSYAGAEPV